MKIKELPYKGKNHGSFEEEWGAHKKISEWWYSTGYFNDKEGRLYSFQFTLLNLKVAVFRPSLVMLALTDFSSGKHHYFQDFALLGNKISITEKSASFLKKASLTKEQEDMRLNASHSDFSLDLFLNYGKGAVWHCDDGFLKMGVEGKEQNTIYYSYTNMPTKGVLTLNGQSKEVEGKSWFDKQGGPFTLLNRYCMWEWFSLRFFDGEEIMLFSFPQSDYQDGTYIDAKGGHGRLTQYKITPLDFVYPDGKTKYSFSWEVSLGVKDGYYKITPLSKGQMNIGYFELLALITDKEGKEVGYCFVELLPGVYNDKFAFQLLKKSKNSVQKAAKA